MPPRLVAFDLDGTLVNSEPTWLCAEQALLKRRGKELNLPAQLQSNLVGLSLIDFCEKWRLLYDLEEPAELLARELSKEFIQSISQSTQLRDGAVEAVRVAKESGALMCICSSSERIIIETEVRSLPELREAFCPDSFFSGAEYPHSKPAPDVYLAALAHYGVDAADAIAIEDSPNGARAALAAGYRCLLVPETQHAAEIMKTLPGDLSLNGMREAAEKLRVLLKE